MIIIDIDDKADDLKTALRNLVDAALDMERAEVAIVAMLPAEVSAAIVSYVRTKHVGCPRCGKQTTAAAVQNLGTCGACWDAKRVRSDAQA